MVLGEKRKKSSMKISCLREGVLFSLFPSMLHSEGLVLGEDTWALALAGSFNGRC